MIKDTRNEHPDEGMYRDGEGAMGLGGTCGPTTLLVPPHISLPRSSSNLVGHLFLYMWSLAAPYSIFLEGLKFPTL